MKVTQISLILASFSLAIGFSQELKDARQIPPKFPNYIPQLGIQYPVESMLSQPGTPLEGNPNFQNENPESPDEVGTGENAENSDVEGDDDSNTVRTKRFFLPNFHFYNHHHHDYHNRRYHSHRYCQHYHYHCYHRHHCENVCDRWGWRYSHY